MPGAGDPSRDLLFGVLAWQHGLIDQGALLAAIAAWTRDKAHSLADHLVALGHLDAPRRKAVEAIAALHVQVHSDDTAISLAALPGTRSTWMQLARLGDTEIDATLAKVGPGLEPTVADSQSDRAGSYALGSAMHNGQRFRILRPHARGGLGAVFVALDTELHREVALKQILDSHADDPVSRQRFLLEAEVTGGLEHPGIVPVYGLGADGDGRPYYAMRFIKGDSLQEAIQRFHADPALRKDRGHRSLGLRNLLRRFTDVCNAIDYAHSRGVLHRDIKPNNIILGTHGETLVVDWGLAKSLGQRPLEHDSREQALLPSPGSGSTETLPGSTLGTPAYMSPEQAEGRLDELGPHSDVYSLGATLYHLLTGRPPFAGDLAEVLRQVGCGEFRPPRAVLPSIDPALEAVCRKAMAREPANRYASSRALADDVERWMAGEPVTAWHEPLPIRMRRWGRRHRTAMTAALVALLVALAGTAAVLAVQTSANIELTASNKALAIANGKVRQSNAGLQAANARERQRFDLALEAIKFFHGEVSEDLLLKQKAFEALRTKLLRGAADFYGKLEGLLQGQTDPASRAAVGKAYEELGHLTATIGNRAEALAVHRKGLAVRRALLRLPAAGAPAKLDVARSLKSVGRLQMDTGDTAGALASCREARSLALELVATGASEPARSVLADIHHVIASVLSETGNPTESIAEYRKELTICRDLAAQKPGDPQVENALAWCYNNLAGGLLVTGQRAESFRSYEAARSIRQLLVARTPSSAPLQRALSIDHFNMGIAFNRIGMSRDALACYEKAWTISQTLTDTNPTVTEFQDDLADADYAVATELGNIGRQTEALAAYESARAIWHALVAANPKVIKFQRREANALVCIASIKEARATLAQARELYEETIRIYESIVRAEPHVTEYQSDLAMALLHLGTVSYRTGRAAEAIDDFERSRTIQQALVDANPTLYGYRPALANAVLSIGRIRQAEGRLAEAANDYRQGASIMEQMAMQTGQDRYNFGCALALLAGLAGQPGTGIPREDGQAEANRAMTLLNAAAEAGYTDLALWRTDTDLDPLRSRPDFQLLMMDLAMPREPFARAEPSD